MSSRRIFREPTSKQQLLQAFNAIAFGPARRKQKQEQQRSSEAQTQLSTDDGKANTTFPKGQVKASDIGEKDKAKGWKEVTENLLQAREELKVITDVIRHLEGDTWLTTLNIATAPTSDSLQKLAKKQHDLNVRSLFEAPQKGSLFHSMPADDIGRCI